MVVWCSHSVGNVTSADAGFKPAGVFVIVIDSIITMSIGISLSKEVCHMGRLLQKIKVII